MRGKQSLFLTFLRRKLDAHEGIHGLRHAGAAPAGDITVWYIDPGDTGPPGLYMQVHHG